MENAFYFYLLVKENMKQKKIIIVMTINIGYDEVAGQFDIMIPGGGTIWRPFS